MTILQRIESAAADILVRCITLQGDGANDQTHEDAIMEAFDRLQAAMIEYETGQAPTPLPARTPLTDAWGRWRPLNNDGVSDEIPDPDPRGNFSDDLHERDIGPRD